MADEGATHMCGVPLVMATLLATPEELIAFAKQRLVSFKVPRHVVFAKLQKISTGKIQKHVLRSQARTA